MTKALIITSDFKLSVWMRWMLNYSGFSITSASNLECAKKLLEQVEFKIVLLDFKSFQAESLAFFKSMRGRGLYTPVIYMAEKGQEDLIKAECSGLDDVLLDPFSFAVVKTKLQTALRKAHSTHKPLLYSDILLDESNRTLIANGNRVILGRLEMKILLLLCVKAGRVVALDKIQIVIEHEGVRFSTRVFHHISNLRKKLESAGISSLQINFVKDGYRVDLA